MMPSVIKTHKKPQYIMSECVKQDVKKFFRDFITKSQSDRVEKKPFQEFIKQQYNGTKLGEAIGRQLVGLFSFHNNSLVDKDFVKDVEKFCNKDSKDIKKFIFECYDCFNNNDQITE